MSKSELPGYGRERIVFFVDLHNENPHKSSSNPAQYILKFYLLATMLIVLDECDLAFFGFSETLSLIFLKVASL